MKNSMLDSKRSVDFRKKQAEFAAYIRDPELNPAPLDVEERRMSMYRELFFNNIEGFLSGNFPVLRKILDDSQWIAIVQDFFAKHPCKSPYFSEIPEEFLNYLQNKRDGFSGFPFILEMAHYEWVEMALSIAKENLTVSKKNTDNLLTSKITLSPLAWPLVYIFPVHKIAPEFLPIEPPELPTCLIVYRNIDDDVNFIEITPITYRLLEIIQENQNTLTIDCLNRVAEESSHFDTNLVISEGLKILKELSDKSIITFD
jgi:uncharacterized protein